MFLKKHPHPKTSIPYGVSGEYKTKGKATVHFVASPFFTRFSWVFLKKHPHPKTSIPYGVSKKYKTKGKATV